jgi:hypothetical protein
VIGKFGSGRVGVPSTPIPKYYPNEKYKTNIDEWIKMSLKEKFEKINNTFYNLKDPWSDKPIYYPNGKIMEIYDFIKNKINEISVEEINNVVIKKTKTPKITTEKKQVYKKKAIPKKIKSLVWNKYIGEDNGTGFCLCCKMTKIKQMDFHCGHFISEFNGGEMTVNNLRPICASCNSSMGKSNMDEFITKHKLYE